MFSFRFSFKDASVFAIDDKAFEVRFFKNVSSDSSLACYDIGKVGFSEKVRPYKCGIIETYPVYWVKWDNSYLIIVNKKNTMLQNYLYEWKFKNEVALICNSKDTKYEVAVAADFGTAAGFSLAHKFNTTNLETGVLFVAFSHNEKAALCVYSMESIKKAFENGATVSAEPIATFDKSITIVKTTVANDNNIVFLGMIDGEMKRLAMTSDNKLFEYTNIMIQKNSPIKAMQFDGDGKLYAMTKNYVTVSEISDNCSKLGNDCSSCQGQNSPFCGYCPHLQSCTTQSQCVDPTHGNTTVSWKNSVSTFVMMIISWSKSLMNMIIR